MCFQKIREGGRKGDVMLARVFFGEDDGGWQRGCKKSKLEGSRSHIFKYDTKLQK